MKLSLTGLREAQRSIEIQAEAFNEKAKKAIDQELEYLHGQIRARLGSNIGAYLKIDYETKTLHLEYRMANGGVTARDYHNPTSQNFNWWGNGQPFQDVLMAEGYQNISPGPGESIQQTHGKGDPPGVRITATLGPIAIARIKRFINS